MIPGIPMPRTRTVIRYLIVLIAALTLAGETASANATEPTWETARAEADRGGYELITTDDLWALYQQADELLLIDTRQGWEYRMGHIAGAFHFPMKPTRWERWSSRSALRELLGEDKEKPLVFY